MTFRKPFQQTIARAALCLAALLAPAAATADMGKPANGQAAQRVETPISTMEAALNSGAKLICSDTFIAERPLNDIIEKTLLSMAGAQLYATLPDEHWPYTLERYKKALDNVEIDKKKKSVELRSGPYVGKARYYGDQGCAILHPLADDAWFDPKPVPRKKAVDDIFPADGALLDSNDALPEGYDRAALETAANIALASQSNGAAFLVMHNGRLVIERYAEGVTEKTPLHNWSMGKSIIATLIGRLEERGLLSLDDPAPVDLWNLQAEDPRRAIKIRNLLQMNSGLSCEDWTPRWTRRSILDDHNMIYQAPVDVIQHAIASPAEHAPGEKWSYSNCDMQVLGHVIKSLASENGDYLTWPYTDLYNRIGMAGMVSEVDTYGNFHLTGYDYGTARDWARYGLFYLNDGVWNGERLLSKEFVKLVSSPGATWYDDEGRLGDFRGLTYGAGHWLNTGGSLALPTDTFFPQGFSDNFTFIVPSENLVIVLLHFTSLEAEGSDANAVLKPLLTGLGIELERE